MYNFDHALLACMNFLEVEATELDVGLSLSLQRRARTYATEIEQISFLASHEVQELLVTFLVNAAASNLEVERRHAQAKRWEATRLTHIATASKGVVFCDAVRLNGQPQRRERQRLLPTSSQPRS